MGGSPARRSKFTTRHKHTGSGVNDRREGKTRCVSKRLPQENAEVRTGTATFQKIRLSMTLIDVKSSVECRCDL